MLSFIARKLKEHRLKKICKVLEISELYPWQKAFIMTGNWDILFEKRNIRACGKTTACNIRSILESKRSFNYFVDIDFHKNPKWHIEDYKMQYMRCYNKGIKLVKWRLNVVC